MKNPMTLAGIEPATFRFVAQHLNHCATVVPSTGTIIVFLRQDEKVLDRNGGRKVANVNVFRC